MNSSETPSYGRSVDNEEDERELKIEQLNGEIKTLTVQIGRSRKDLNKELRNIDKMVDEGCELLRAKTTKEAIKSIIKKKVADLIDKRDKVINSAASEEGVSLGLIDAKNEEISRLEQSGESDIFQAGEDEFESPFMSFIGKVNIGLQIPENPACASEFINVLLETVPHTMVPFKAPTVSRGIVITKKRLLGLGINATPNQITEALSA